LISAFSAKDIEAGSFLYSRDGASNALTILTPPGKFSA
jgi:hypothetical protein